jgi:O-acetyl-ADP-ribose deacetylase (regulator of RNase III)
MIEYRKGDLLDYRNSNPDKPTVIAHSANNKGVMGSGVARAIMADPIRGKSVYADYMEAFKLTGLQLGMVIYTPASDGQFSVLTIIGQDGYGYDGKKYVDYNALKKAFKEINKAQLFTELAMPKIGAGLGGGDWAVIEKIIKEELTNKKVIVYEL